MNHTKGFDLTKKYYGHYRLCPEFDIRPSYCICDRLEQVMDATRADEQAKVYAFATRMVLRRGDYLREKVEALRAEDPHNQPVRDAYDAVLALLDGVES